MSALTLTCPYCRGALHVRSPRAGAEVRCPHCRQQLTVPAKLPAPPPPPVQPPPLPPEPPAFDFAGQAASPTRYYRGHLRIPGIFHVAAWLIVLTLGLFWCWVILRELAGLGALIYLSAAD